MSLQAELLRFGIRIFLRRRAHQQFDLGKLRSAMRRMEKLVPAPPRRCQTVTLNVGDLVVHRVTTPESRNDRHVLYLHGGAYVSGSPRHYRHFTWRLADAFKAHIWLLGYRLAPEHPYPAALDDAEAVYDWLIGTTPEDRQLLMMGDSAGGGLTLGLLLKLRDDNKPLPKAAMALSPWTDLALTGASLRSNASTDPMLNADDLPELAQYYLAGADPRTPYASPLYGDTSGLPPVLIHVGGDEILLDDAVRMAQKLRRHNSQSKVEVWPRMPHVWHLFAPVLPEARQAIAAIAEFVAEAA
ncbi:MAG: alpha/beta hydrolase [Bradyrhizobium sp.]|uniref:alpha/beta hydrolase n=1 Tax=Bradyrhizobium sp. TaxID=376 RepID=UPI0025BD11AC|nr:alpha/beta hydrolase [Bradyrhizobium sp.]MBI5265182.1 alpha/beta hydrolase [Bradyrhizobium sp.]